MLCCGDSEFCYLPPERAAFLLKQAINLVGLNLQTLSCLQWVAVQFILFSNSLYVQVQILARDLDSLYKLNLVFPSLALTLQCPGFASFPWLPQLERQQAFSQSFSHSLLPPLYCRLPYDKMYKSENSP